VVDLVNIILCLRVQQMTGSFLNSSVTVRAKMHSAPRNERIRAEPTLRRHISLSRASITLNMRETNNFKGRDL
jgi:hypothetical protein